MATMGKLANKFAQLKETLREYKPHITTAYLTYLDLTVQEPPGSTKDEVYSHVILETSTDPLFKRIGTSSMRRVARPRLDAGDWYAVVILADTGAKDSNGPAKTVSELEVAAYFWVALKPKRSLFSGVMNVHVLPDEAYGFDLYVKPEHRRGSLGNYVADIVITDLKDRGLKYGYTHLLYDNIPSIFWHDGVGFNVAQSFNLFSFGPRVTWKIPLSESPRYGPLSRKGRFNDPEPKECFGGSLLPK